MDTLLERRSMQWLDDASTSEASSCALAWEMNCCGENAKARSHQVDRMIVLERKSILQGGQGCPGR